MLIQLLIPVNRKTYQRLFSPLGNTSKIHFKLTSIVYERRLATRSPRSSPSSKART